MKAKETIELLKTWFIDTSEMETVYLDVEGDVHYVYNPDEPLIPWMKVTRCNLMSVPNMTLKSGFVGQDVDDPESFHILDKRFTWVKLIDSDTKDDDVEKVEALVKECQYSTNIATVFVSEIAKQLTRSIGGKRKVEAKDFLEATTQLTSIIHAALLEELKEQIRSNDFQNLKREANK